MRILREFLSDVSLFQAYCLCINGFNSFLVPRPAQRTVSLDGEPASSVRRRLERKNPLTGTSV